MPNIIRITIDSSSGPFSSYSYADRLEISPDNIGYVKAIDGGDSYEWSYKTSSRIFNRKYKIATELLEKYLNEEGVYIPDTVSSFTIYALYDDGDIKEKSFAITFEDNKMEDLMFVIKDLIPHNEELPEYFMYDAVLNPLFKDEED